MVKKRALFHNLLTLMMSQRSLLQDCDKLFFWIGTFICADTVYIAYIQYDFNNLTFTMYSSVLIAGQFVNLGVKENNPVTQMKLQKMVFFAHGLHLALNNGDPLIREKFLAWKFGPVVPTIYQLYKKWGNSPIIEKTSITVNSQPLANFSELTPSAIEAINNTWEITKDVDAITLSNWSHATNSPWDITYKQVGENGVIDDNLIRNYFEQQIKSPIPAV